MLRGLIVITAALVAGLVLLAFVLLEDTPLVAASAPPSPEDVAATRQLVRDIRTTAGNDTSEDTLLRTDAAQLNSAIRLGARFIRGFRGQISVNARDVLGEVALPVPWITGQKWLNLHGRVPAFEGPFRLSQARIGPLDIPPDLALSLARIGANVALGNGFGDKVVAAATEMQITGDTLRFRIALDDVGKNGVMRSTFGTLRGSDMPSAEHIEDYHQRIRTAMADGTLQQTGSFLPYLQFTLRAALENSTADTLPDAYTAAIFGLAKACGAKGFAMIVGRLAFDSATFAQDWPTSCDEVTFNGRIDSRRHFVVSAALQAASNRGFAMSIGEFKELYDSLSEGNGFDFTDMAANLSGIRLSDVMMATPSGDWPALLTKLETENDVIIPYDGIPGLMTEDAFEAQFGDLESPAYKAMIAQIERRIDGLRLYHVE